MKKHNRQGQPRTNPIPFVCTHCQANECEECTDILRIVANLPEICNCQAPDHSGEPVLQQVRDPFDGSVYAPGLVVSEDGVVTKEAKPYE